MVGREKEISDLISLLKKPDIGLITLHGFGGTGKTRLAVELGQASLEMFPDGVWFVSLAPLTSPEHLVAATASALQFSFQSHEDQQGQLLHFLQGKKLLLIFDNIEHLLPGGSAHLETILQNAPNTRLLVTSRQPINAPWETVYPLQGLEYELRPSQANGGEPAAVQLFLQHLSRVAGPEAGNERACASQICQIVRGLPLALLLAASWGRALDCEEIAQEIQRGVGFLQTQQKTFPERHSSMQAVFDYSWRLLSEREQAALRKLSIFRGGFDRDAAAQVAGADLPTLATFIDQSFVERASKHRYQIHELLRQYLYERLVEAGEEASTRDQHLDYYVYLAAQAEPELRRKEQKVWLTRLQIEIDNIRAALDWVLTSKQPVHIEQGLRMMAALERFWLLHTYTREGHRYLLVMLNELPDLPAHDNYGRGMTLAAKLSYWLENYPEMYRLAKEALQLGFTLNNPQVIGDSFLWQGMEMMLHREFAVARSLLERAIEHYQQCNCLPGLIEAMEALGRVDFLTKNFPASFSKLTAALDLAREQGDIKAIYVILRSLGQLGVLDPQIGIARARDYSTEGLQYAREIEDKYYIELMLENLGEIARSEGEMEQAAAFFQEAYSIASELGRNDDQIELQAILGLIYLRLGKYDESQQMMLDSLVRAQLVEDLGWLLPLCILGWAGLMAIKGQGQFGARLLGALEHQELLTLWPADKIDYGRISASIKAQLPEKQFNQLYKEGQALSLAEAVQLVQTHGFTEKGRSEEGLNQLTKREIEILRLVALGLSDAQIAERLVLSPRTVNAHLTSIYNKLGVNSRSAATRYAMEHGLA